MRVCIEKTTGKLITSCTTSDEETIRKYAHQYGYEDKNIEIKEIIEEEFQQILEGQPKPPHISTQEELLKERIDELELYILTQEGLI
ncbi:hypothetical protein SAMN05446037_100258 [Anaerovirgula multivorans]|uniref:Uncharacterized protein n=1 Tax=Anaerovirgula multivorans TaxID=312168 RepID=A0A239AJY2_9FIRM|nr:hypothetical protein [Anaerovirgula multivorans]SNR95354.1 hypothetical protein SAMN05446037_100258 [Anaerovirgula multivorans]